MKIEKVTWEDSFTDDSENWKELETLSCRPPTLTSVGVVKEYDDYICVIPHFSVCAEGTVVCGEIYIPKVAVICRLNLGCLVEENL